MELICKKKTERIEWITLLSCKYFLLSFRSLFDLVGEYVWFDVHKYSLEISFTRD